MFPVNCLPLASFSGVILGWLMAFLSLFLILLILVQRGRGGGLSGALGGPGGQSAFGSKAGDTFTVITVTVAGIWIFVCAFTMWLLGMHNTTIADFPDTSVAPGPGDERAAEDLASGLVVPTDASDLEDKSDSTGSLVPAGVATDDTDASEEKSEGSEKAADEKSSGEKPAEETADATSTSEAAETADQPEASKPE